MKNKHTEILVVKFTLIHPGTIKVIVTIHNVFYQVLLDTKVIPLFIQVHMARYINTQYSINSYIYHEMYASDYNWLLNKTNAITFSESLSMHSSVLTNQLQLQTVDKTNLGQTVFSEVGTTVHAMACTCSMYVHVYVIELEITHTFLT